MLTLKKVAAKIQINFINFVGIAAKKKTLINNTLLDHYIESGELFRCWAHLKAVKVLYAGSMVFLTNVAKTYNKSLQT